jgi:TonB family protein
MLTRIIAVVLLVMVQMPVPFVVLADGDVEAFKAAYASYQTALETNDIETASVAAAQALELGKLVFPDDSPSLLALYVNHGDLLINQQRYLEAATLLQEAVTKFEKHYGKKDERLIYALWVLAEANGGTGEHEIAVKQLIRLSRMVKKAHGADSRVFADVQQLLGQESYISGGHYKKTRRPLAKAYDIYSTLHGDSIYQTGLAALWLGKAELLGKNGNERAEKLFLKALSIFKGTTPPGHPLRLAAHHLLVHIYEDTERSGQATKHLLAIARMGSRTEIDGDLPLYKKSPAYPQAATGLEKEGWVLVEFTVSASGTVVDPTVVDSAGGEEFERAALDAIRAYRYVPTVLDGQVIATNQVRNLVTFKMADILSPDVEKKARPRLPRIQGTKY